MKVSCWLNCHNYLGTPLRHFFLIKKQKLASWLKISIASLILIAEIQRWILGRKSDFMS